MFQSITNLKQAAVSKLALAAAAGCAALTLGAFATPAQASFQEGDYELRLDGFAQNSVDFDGVVLSLGGTIGYFVSDEFEVGLRQNLTYSDFAGSNLNGGTGIFVNYHFLDRSDMIRPFIGAAFGYNYGDSVRDTFFAGPEAGVKVFFGDNSEWFLFGQIEYQFFFRSGGDATDNFDDGTFVYRLGVGVLL